MGTAKSRAASNNASGGQDCLHHFNSLDALLDYVGQSKQGGVWQKQGQNYSLTNSSSFAGSLTVDDTMDMCRTLRGYELPERIRTIDSLAAELEGQLPPALCPRRQPQWGAHGNAISIHRVLSGRLGDAWRKTTRTVQPGNAPRTLIIPAVVPSSASAQEILWGAVATLALAQAVYAQGARVEIWACGWHMHALGDSYGNGKDYRWICPLIRSGERFSPQLLALTTYPAWSRRLSFRLLEMAAEDWTGGVHDACYGRGVASPGQWRAFFGTELRAILQANPGEIQLGATHGDRIHDRPSALKWAQQQLQRQ